MLGVCVEGVVVDELVAGQPNPRCSSLSVVSNPGRHSPVQLLHPHSPPQRRAQVMDVHMCLLVVVTIAEVGHPLPRLSSCSEVVRPV